MERSRDTAFPDRVRTRVWEEIPSGDNPWIATGARCHGYALEEMVQRLSFEDTIFLLLRGELPDAGQRRLFSRFLVSFCNPGPRHAATRAVMNAAASGTRSSALPSIGLALLGGEHLGSAEVEQAAAFILAKSAENPVSVAAQRPALPSSEAGPDRRAAPGFGTLHGEIDAFCSSLAPPLLELARADGPLAWSREFAVALAAQGCGWLQPGLAAACLLELGFAPRATGLLFQLASLPGLLAHALETAGRGITAMPFVPEERYEYLDAPAGGVA
jgi:citrate synthase